MAVNGVEIKVGQRWKTRGGEITTVLANDGHADWPWDLENGDSVADDGYEFGADAGTSNSDLIELVEHADGFKPWAGGEQPVAYNVVVTCRFTDGSEGTNAASSFCWSDKHLIAYKVVGAEQTDADKLASETLTALGYHFDGQCWVQDAEPKPLDVQEGGNHYKSLAIQPVEYIQANNLDYFQGNVVKYITRHKAKNGTEDVKKAIHYCQLILQLQYEGAAK